MFGITHIILVPIKSVKRTISPFIRVDMFGSSLHTINNVCVRNKVYCEQLIMEFKFLNTVSLCILFSCYKCFSAGM